MSARLTSHSLLLLAFFAQATATQAGDGSERPITPEVVAQRIKQMKALGPKDWTKIPWTASLLDARRVSRQEHCPIFLFTFEGNLASGRC